MHLRRWSVPALALILLTSITVSAQRPAHRAQTPVIAKPAVQSVQTYKGIFEPVNYGQDINFTDVFFVSPNVGWVSGEHATILKTTDGGTTWKAQVGGDPNGTEKPIGQLRFLDARHGWAVTDDQRLLRTMDGENWEQIGEQSVRPGSGYVDYAFTSVRHGIALGGNMGGFFVTNDGGRHWQNVTACKVRATVQGLPRTEDCRVAKLQMLSGNSGYASADWSGGLAFFRTDDGGEHWTSIVNNVSECCGPDFFFTDMNHGAMVFNNGKTYLTDDGAGTWHALISGSVGIGSGQGQMPIHFADPEVGWVIGESPDNSRTFRVSFSANAGRHWKTSQNIAFPVESDHLKFNLVRRDRAYVIGDHGMIYRYRVVPKTYTVANSFDAPAMPEASDAILQARTQRVRNDIGALQAKLSAAMASGNGSATSGVATSASSAAAATEGQSSHVAGGSSAGSSASAAGQLGAADTGQSLALSDTAGASGGFMQQTDVSATADAIAGGTADASAAFAQDTSPPSAVLATCCAAVVQQLQTDTSGFVAQIPAVTSQLRPLNLIVAGLQLAATLMNQGQGLWNQFKTLKHAPSPQAASQALQQLSTTLNTVQQASSTGLQNPGAWFAANAPAAFTQDVGASTLAATAGAALQQAPATTTSDSRPGTTATTQPQAGDQKKTDNIVDQAKKKLKDKIKVPW